jgi:UDP-glucose 4-epimerase
MKILVTGGAGFIGTNLIRRLLFDGHEVYSLDNYDSGLEENHQVGATYLRGDITTIDSLGGDFAICFHLAAVSRIQPSFENPSETFRVNTLGTQAVCDWARKHQVKVVYAGSSSRWHNPHQSPYALYKYAGEEICKMYRTVYGTAIEIARFYNVYGPYEIVDGDWAAVIGLWRRQVRDGLPITIVGDGEQRRDFTHVDDIVDGLIRIAFSSESHDDAWELGTGMNYSINEVYTMFSDRFGVDKISLPDQPGNYRATLRENNDAIQRLGWTPTPQLPTYIKQLNS